MKKWLIASGICAVIFFFLGMAIPLSILFTDTGKGIKFSVIFLYMAIVAICITIIMVTTLRMADYASKIDNLDKANEDAEKRNDRLNELIRHYNKLISQTIQP